MTSNSALQKVKRLYQAQKAGHTGSLDPLATGVLPLCFGEATKVSHYLLDSDKTYIAQCILGSVTTTGDSDGEVIDTKPIPELNEKQLIVLLNSFTGIQQQTPPMYSALKHNGRPLYEYARKGIEIERESRQITIFDIKLIKFSSEMIEIEVHCSKGTYIRTLCEDIGQSLGCGAYISSLRRIQSGPFSLEQSITLDSLHEIEQAAGQVQLDAILLATDTAITTIPAVIINEAENELINHGHSVACPPEKLSSPGSHYRLYFKEILIALAILNEEGQLQPKRLLFLPSP